MTKLDIFVSCTTPTFPRRIPPNPNFKADNISSRQNQHFRVGNICLPQTQISKLKKHFTQDHIWKLEGFVFSTNPNFEVGSIRLSIRTRLLRLVVAPKPRFQCFVFQAQISTMETWVVCSKHTFQSSTYLLPVQGPSSKVKYMFPHKPKLQG